MTCQRVFDLALRLLAESSVSGEVEDYADRAPALILLCVTDLAPIDGGEREEKAELPDCALSAPFPLAERFLPCVAYYLAAMLVLEERPELSKSLYAMYESHLPLAVNQPIRDRYGFGR